MKNTLLNFSITTLFLLPVAGWTQGTFLDAPNGGPSKALAVDSAGMVGVGTLTPMSYGHGGTAKLVEIHNDGTSTHSQAHLILSTAADGIWGSSIGSVTFAQPTGMAAFIGAHTRTATPGQASAALVFGTKGETDPAPPIRMTIETSGNVGIGNTAPTARLSLARGDSHEIAEFLQTSPSAFNADLWLRGGSTSDWLLSKRTVDGSGDFWLYSPAGQASMVIKQNGFVGFGTLAPQAALDVNGKARATVLELTSDRNAKMNFHPVSYSAVLEGILSTPITTWEHTNAPGIKHIGPMAQDFHAAFHMGTDDTHIATVDADGVAFAGIKGLHAKMVTELAARDAEIASLKRQVADLTQEVAGVQTLATRLVALEKALSKRDVQQASYRPEAAR